MLEKQIASLMQGCGNVFSIVQIIYFIEGSPMNITAILYLRNKETQQKLQVIVSIQYDANF